MWKREDGVGTQPMPSWAMYAEAMNKFTRSATAFIEQVHLLTQARTASTRPQWKAQTNCFFDSEGSRSAGGNCGDQSALGGTGGDCSKCSFCAESGNSERGTGCGHRYRCYLLIRMEC